MKEDFSEAYAVFACAYGDWTVTATVHNPVMSEVSPATYTQDRIVKFTATTIFRDETYVKESGNVTVEGSAAAAAVTAQLAADLEAQRAAEAEQPQPEEPGQQEDSEKQEETGGSNSGGNFFSRLWNRIRDFFACIAAFFRNLFRR